MGEPLWNCHLQKKKNYWEGQLGLLYGKLTFNSDAAPQDKHAFGPR